MVNTRAPTALLFDLDDTLIPEASVLAGAYHAVARAIHGDSASAAQAGDVRLAAHRFWEANVPAPEFCAHLHIGPSDGLSSEFTGTDPQLAAVRAFIPEYRTHAFEAAVTATPDGRGHALVEADEGHSDGLREVWWQARMQLQTVFPGARELLTQLRDSGRYRMAVVTNGTSDFQRRKLAATGLERFFDAVIVAGDVGAAKPCAEPFQAALAALGVPAQSAVMIGNDRTRDIDGARRFGIGGLWVQPHEHPEPGAITDLAQLPALLGA